MSDLDWGSLDIVVPCRTGNKNDELRYAMRSWERNAPHRDVYLFGAPPGWTVNVTKIPFKQGDNVRANTTEAMFRACQDPRISNPFIWMNDDYFIMKHLEEYEKQHRGPLEDVIRAHPEPSHSYPQGMVATKNLLIDLGFNEEYFLSYELHMPMIIHKQSMLYTLGLYEESGLPNLHKRTLYGNIFDYGEVYIADNKVNEKAISFDEEATYVSTSDISFEEHGVGKWIREEFKEPSVYELNLLN